MREPARNSSSCGDPSETMEKTSNARLTSSESIGLRLWQAYKGPGKFKFVGTFDPSTLEYLNKQLKPCLSPEIPQSSSPYGGFPRILRTSISA